MTSREPQRARSQTKAFYGKGRKAFAQVDKKMKTAEDAEDAGLQDFNGKRTQGIRQDQGEELYSQFSVPRSQFSVTGKTEH